MSLGWRPGLPLAGLPAGGPALAAWLKPAPDGGPDAAALETRAAVSGPGGGAPAPLFEGSGGAAGGAAGPAAGRLDVVVTGQQPGFLGGPLLTLHKIATAIALAEARTAAGLPSVAAFWCGDDDDDLVEALDPVGWDPGLGTLVRADGRAAARKGSHERAMIGPTPVRRWCGPGASLLERLARRPGADALTRDLAELWRSALAEDWDWSRLNVAAIGRVFASHRLLVVRGNDPSLHAAAAPFYAMAGGRRERSRDRVRREGERLAAVGVDAAISERSLRRDLFVAVDGRRVFVPDAEQVPPASTLRPGVLLRSLVQDWLLRPAAVVVGPGEAAYLAQLRPLYGDLGVPRAPLVPRLFAWVLPPGFPAERVAALDAGPPLDRIAAETLAGELAEETAARLAAALGRGLALPADRARDLAAGRARRWRRGVAAMLHAESVRQWERAHADVPAWILPEGRRQERRLAAIAAAALLGETLPVALVAAARDHLAAGAEGRWREYLVG